MCLTISKFIEIKQFLLHQTDDIPRILFLLLKTTITRWYNQINRVVDQTVSAAINDAFTNIGHYIENFIYPTKSCLMMFLS